MSFVHRRCEALLVPPGKRHAAVDNQPDMANSPSTTSPLRPDDVCVNLFDPCNVCVGIVGRIFLDGRRSRFQQPKLCEGTTVACLARTGDFFFLALARFRASGHPFMILGEPTANGEASHYLF